MEICKVESCGYESKVEGLCYPHYKRFMRIGTTELHSRLCSVEGCEEKNGAKGLCIKHYTTLKYHENKGNKKNKVVIKESVIFKDGKWKIQDESDYVITKK